MKESKNPVNRVKISAKSVFEVEDSRLGLGVLSRPLLDAEARSFRQAWEREAVPGFEDLEINARRVSFMASPEKMNRAWEAIDRLLASVTEPVRKAS